MNDKHLLMPEFVLSSELPWTLRTLERTLSCMQHLVTSYMLWSREFLSADVTGMVVMFFRCSAEKLKVSSTPISYLKSSKKLPVYFHVCSEFGHLLESFTTNRAFVWLLRFLQRHLPTRSAGLVFATLLADGSVGQLNV